MNSTIFEHTFTPGQTVRYRRLVNGTCYHADTLETIVDKLEFLRRKQRKIRLFYGDTQSGQSWLDEQDVIGCLGRSTGAIKVPLLVQAGELGGSALLDHCIIRIDTPRKVLYQHDHFHTGQFLLQKGQLERLPWEVVLNNCVHARFANQRTAEKYLAFIQGIRFTLE